MGKFKTLNEQIVRMQELMGINEQQSSSRVLEVVTDSYTASNCDELHAFEGTGGKPIGEMNTKVNSKIKEYNDKGIKVKPTKVSVQVNGMTVTWSVTLEQSNYNFKAMTSRGAGCNGDVDNRYDSDSVGNGIKSIVKKIGEKLKISPEKIELINDYRYTDKSGKNNDFRQAFYRYSYPNDPLNQSTNQTTSKEQTTEEIKVTGKDLNDLRTKLKELPSTSIDKENIDTDFQSMTITFSKGSDTYKSFSLIFDPDRQTLEDRFETKIKSENPTVENLLQGSWGSMSWMILGFK